MAEPLIDWAPIEFAEHVFRKHPAPRGPDRIDDHTGEVLVGQPLWDHGIRLNPGQRKVFQSRARYKGAGGGWRGGKSWTGGASIYIDYLWRRQVRGITTDIWGVIADTYSMAEEEMRHISRLFVDGNIPHEFRQPEGRPWVITFPDSDNEIRTLSASDVTKIASRPFRGLVIAEANQTVKQTFENALGRVMETRGWILLEGTFESEKDPWYSQLCLAWQNDGAMGEFFSLPSWENQVFYPGGREDPAILQMEKDLSPDRFREKVAGEPVKRADLALRYADARFHVRHRYPRLGTSYDPEQPVTLWSDPGTAHAYAVFAVQFFSQSNNPLKKGNIAWIIDAVYRWGRTAQDIIAECAGRPWAQNVDKAVMDFAARQRRAEGLPIVEQWTNGWYEQTGRRLWVFTQPVPLAPGYDIHKRALLNSWPEDLAQLEFNRDGKMRSMTDPEGPRLMFDPRAAAPMFGGQVDELFYAGEYSLHRSRTNRGGTVTTDEYIDIDNDGIKAINYGLWDYFGAVGRPTFYTAGATMPWTVEVR